MTFLLSFIYRGHDVPIFILYQGYPPHIGEGYEKRLALAEDATGEKASLLIKKVQREDEGWYECKGMSDRINPTQKRIDTYF
jgi:Immunoglobulin V-set domain